MLKINSSSLHISFGKKLLFLCLSIALLAWQVLRFPPIQKAIFKIRKINWHPIPCPKISKRKPDAVAARL